MAGVEEEEEEEESRLLRKSEEEESRFCRKENMAKRDTADSI